MFKVANNAFTMGLCILGLCIWFSSQEINVLRCRLVRVENCQYPASFNYLYKIRFPGIKVETRRLELCNACGANSVVAKTKDRHRNECSTALFVRQVHQLVAKRQIKKASSR